MMNILKGERVTLTRTMEKLNLVGQTFEVANITETSVVIRDVKTKIAVAAISIDDFDNYFVKDNVNHWIPWTPLVDVKGNVIAFYRTNGKKVQVKIQNKCGEASCNLKTNDKFDLYFGIQLAYLRCQNKCLVDIRKNYQTAIKQIEGNIRENNHIIKQLMDKAYPKDKEVEAITEGK